jgi:hypothetical protein
VVRRSGIARKRQRLADLAELPARGGLINAQQEGMGPSVPERPAKAAQAAKKYGWCRDTNHQQDGRTRHFLLLGLLGFSPWPQTA